MDKALSVFQLWEEEEHRRESLRHQSTQALYFHFICTFRFPHTSAKRKCSTLKYEDLTRRTREFVSTINQIEKSSSN